MKQRILICLCAYICFCCPAVSEALIQCYECHGTSVPIDYRPLDTGHRNITSGAFQGNHRTHLSSSASNTGCTPCHPGSDTYDSSHRNGKIKVSGRINGSPLATPYNSTTSAFSQRAAPTPGSCAGVNCHFEAATPAWGTDQAATTCATCHGAPPADGSHPKHATYYGTDTTSCLKCHQNNPSFAHATSVGKRPLNVRFATAPNSGGSYSGSLAYPGYLPSQGPLRNGTCSGLYCHSNGTSVATGSIPPNTTPAWGSGTLACGACHGNPPGYASGSPKKNNHGLHGAYGCNKCHYRTTTTGTTITNSANHVNQVYDVYSGGGARFTYSYNAAGGSCGSISCHGSTGAQWGSTSCLGCHSVAQGNRVAVGSQFGANSHHIQGTVTDAKCYQCHWEANSDGTINQTYHNAAVSGAAVRLVIYSTLQRPTNAAKYFIAYTANGTRAQIQKISNHCLGCHSSANDLAQPFGDGRTPKQYAWDGTSVGARYSQGGTTTWGKYTAYPNAAPKNITKAFSAHGNAGGNQRGWDTTNGVDGTITNTSGAIAVQCYDCHNSHGSAVSGITSRYSSATGRYRGGLLKHTLRGFGGYSATYRPQAAGSVANKDVRNPGASLCLDCHFSSTPKQAPLAAFKGYTTPWGYNSTFNATQDILGYWDSPFMGYSTAGPEKRYGFKKSNPMKGGHFGASSPLSVQPSSANQIGGLCTPCHDPHGVSPTLGANQQYSVPLLKGTWLTSPYKEDTAPASNVAKTDIPGVGERVQYHIDQNTFGPRISNASAGIAQQESQFAGLCLGCHPKPSLTDGTTHTWKDKNRIHESVKDWKTLNLTKQHNYSCSKCHSPHTNSALPRLMVTNCLDSRHKGRSGLNNNPVLYLNQAFSGVGDGSGGGRIPGSSAGGGSGWEYAPSEYGYLKNAVTCHESPTANNGANSNRDQTWNTVTPWAVATPPPAPTLTPEPDVNSSGGTISLTLDWGAVTCPSGGTTQYLAEVSSASNFSSISYSSAWQTGTSWDQALPIGTWYWRVTARDGSATYAQSPPSASDSFMVVYTVPPAPTLIAAGNSSSSGGNAAKTLSWNAVAPNDGDAIQYFVEVSGASDFATIAYSSSWQSATTWTTALPINTWYWRVTARDSVHTTAVSPPSSSNSFNVVYGPPVAPVLIHQSNSSTGGGSVSKTLQWNAVTPTDEHAMEYYVEVSSASNFSPVDYNSGATWLSGQSWTVSLPTGTWYWRAKARDSVHTTAVSAASASDTFSIVVGPAAPDAPPLTPEAGVNSGCTQSVVHTLEWGAVTVPDGDPAEYYVEVSTSPAFTPISYDSGATWLVGQSLTPPALPNAYNPGTTWYWRVKTRDSLHPAYESAFSSGSFTDYNTYDSCTCDNIGCGGSCPMLYTWDGDKFVFETDLFPRGSLGRKYSTGFQKPNPNDYYVLANNPVVGEDGRYQLRLVEERVEIDYLDNLKLYAVDVPKGRDVYAEIHFSGTTYVKPESLLHTVDRELRHPRSITHVNSGRDVSALLAASDGKYLVLSKDKNNDFDWQTIELDLGDLSRASRIKLIINARTAFFTTAAGSARSKALDSKGQRTRIEVLDAKGNWVRVPRETKELPIPKEFRRDFVVDISNIFLTRTYKVRLSFLNKTHIDAVYLDTTPEEPIDIKEVPLESARLAYHGLSAMTGEEETYGYMYGVTLGKEMGYLPGKYTRFGDVTPLLRQTDDKFVIFGVGDELQFGFKKVPEAPEGKTRRFLIYTNGYYKARKFEVPATVEPLPFAGMSNFPYDPEIESYPADADHTRYRLEYNTRVPGEPSATMGPVPPMESKAARSTQAARPGIVPRRAAEQPVSITPPLPQGPVAVELKDSGPASQPPTLNWLEGIAGSIRLFLVAVLVWLKSLVGL